MFERFTAGARQIVVRAQSEARQLGHGFIGCEHLLLALLAAESSPAADVLREHELTPERVRAEVIRMMRRPGPSAPLTCSTCSTARRWPPSASTWTSCAAGSRRRSAPVP